MIAENVAFEDGDIIFKEDDKADFFYILTSGQIQLYTSAPHNVIYAAETAGDIIGWSSLIGRERYSLSAASVGPTVLLRIEQNRMNAILASDHEVGARFFKHLADALGKRLLHLYPRVT